MGTRYSVLDIDRMRKAIMRRGEIKWPGHFNGFYEDAIEERLRTYITAKVAVEELEGSAAYNVEWIAPELWINLR